MARLKYPDSTAEAIFQDNNVLNRMDRGTRDPVIEMRDDMARGAKRGMDLTGPNPERYNQLRNEMKQHEVDYYNRRIRGKKDI